jgi:hypothetical protein
MTSLALISHDLGVIARDQRVSIRKVVPYGWILCEVLMKAREEIKGMFTTSILVLLALLFSTWEF